MISTGDLVLKIKTYTRQAMPEDYRETKRTLEAQLGEIAVAFAAGIAELKVWRAERAEQEERSRRAQAERWAEAERKRVEAQRLERLLEEVRAWRLAAELRAYVDAASASPAADREGFERWRVWALDQAEALDPLRTGLDLALPDAEFPAWLRG